MPDKRPPLRSDLLWVYKVKLAPQEIKDKLPFIVPTECFILRSYRSCFLDNRFLICAKAKSWFCNDTFCSRKRYGNLRVGFSILTTAPRFVVFLLRISRRHIESAEFKLEKFRLNFQVSIETSDIRSLWHCPLLNSSLTLPHVLRSTKPRTKPRLQSKNLHSAWGFIKTQRRKESLRVKSQSTSLKRNFFVFRFNSLRNICTVSDFSPYLPEPANGSFSFSPVWWAAQIQSELDFDEKMRGWAPFLEGPDKFSHPNFEPYDYRAVLFTYS